MTTPVQQKVLDFVLAPERSNPNHLFKILSSYGFFGQGKEEANVAILHQILEAEKYQFCDAGIEKFKNHMGELLEPKKRRRILVEISVPVTGHSYRPQDVVGDIDKHIIKAFGNKGRGNFYRDGQVKFIKEETK